MSNSSGGTLTLPSPTHVHHVDVQASLRSLRRSLSRSPSKFSLVRTTSQSSSDPSSSPSSPSCRRVQSQHFAHSSALQSANAVHAQSPLATPFRPSVKLSLRSAKSSKSPVIPATSSKPFSRHRTSPKSPSRRALSAASNPGNSTPSSLFESIGPGQENINIFRARSPAPRKSSERTSTRHSMHLDMSGASQLTMSRFTEANPAPNPSSVASPLKRSDATMGLDQSLSGSPKPKRRSCGPSSFGADFNIFDHGPSSPSPELQDDTAREFDWSTTTPAAEPPVMPSPVVMTRRAGSLRKSTLQQRHGAERTSWGRRHAAQQLAQANNDSVTTPNAKTRPRLSLDQFLPPPPRDSPFTAQAPLPNPSAHLLHQQPHQPHPLSRTMTTSSSNSSLPDDSPTHFPIQISERPRAPMNWSKSLPLGAMRPQPDQEGQTVPSVSTPDYKRARPFEGAFASTGLVSKMNRNPELGPSGGGFGAIVPDTPCKKQVNGYATYPPHHPSSSGRTRGRHIKHTFGAPATPFNPPASTRSQNTFGEQTRPVIFNGFGPRHSRKGSLLSLYSDDGRVSLENSTETLANIDNDIPPTPTKHEILADSEENLSQLTNESPTTNRHMPAPTSAIGSGRQWHQPPGFRSSPFDHLELAGRVSPKTPQENMIPPDASRLSISNPADAPLFLASSEQRSNLPPATPTTRLENNSLFPERRAITPINGMAPHELDETLVTRFGKVDYIGKGEFSHVYRVAELSQLVPATQFGCFSTPTHRTPPSPLPGKVFAIKKLSLPLQGEKDRIVRLREVSALTALKGCDHVLQLIDSWEDKGSLYIQTEYCEEGSLDNFLSVVGVRGRLDDFRIWKIMLEICQGLQHIHNAGYVHLDLKPANILINFEGTLKIGDFGLATSLPAEKGPDFEGDREYLAPEALRSEIDKPADIFSLGLIMLEIAANVKLPDNGATWTALREGDFSEVPTLTHDSSAVVRDATGMPVDETERSISILGDDSGFRSSRRSYNFRVNRQSGDIFGLSRKNELQEPPRFMQYADHQSSLDTVVKQMLSAEPMYRPTISQLLGLESLNWVALRQRAGATVFEGNWGPAEEPSEPLFLDTEMTDV